MIIDSHQHFWKYTPENYSWITEEMEVIRRDFLPEDLIGVFKENGINGSVAIQAEESKEDTRFLLKLAETNPFIKGVVGWINLKSLDIEDQLQHAKRFTKLKGFRAIIQGRPDDLYFTNRFFTDGMKKLAGYGFTYDMLVFHNQMEPANRFMEKFPDQYFILDHLGKPAIRDYEIKKWKEQIRIMAQHPRAYCKLSGIVTEADWQKWRYEDISPYLEIAAEYFGTNRLCFGSDWPVCLLAAPYNKVTEIITRFLQQVNETDRKKVWGLNAIEFYQLQ